tara:strand:- start:389 stop:643 length:255 start_codon:yes stop_codon:yes gene_type:complete
MKILTTTITDFRNKIKSYIDGVVNENDIVIIPKNKKGVVVMSIDEYNSITETGYLLSSSANAEKLHKSISDAREGKTKQREIKN